MPNLRIVRKQNKDVNTVSRETDKKIVRHRFGKFFRVAVVIAALIAIAAFINNYYQNATYEGYDILSK